MEAAHCWISLAMIVQMEGVGQAAAHSPRTLTARDDSVGASARTHYKFRSLTGPNNSLRYQLVLMVTLVTRYLFQPLGKSINRKLTPINLIAWGKEDLEYQEVLTGSKHLNRMMWTSSDYIETHGTRCSPVKGGRRTEMSGEHVGQGQCAGV